MRSKTAKTDKVSQSGAALLLCLFALLLLSSIGMFLYMSTGTEARIATNYGNNLNAYYAARSGLEEVRDRVSYPSIPAPPPGGLADLLPKNIAGNQQGVLYVVNPTGGVDPTDPTNPYFDDQLCHDYNSGVAPGGRCGNAPETPNWALPLQNSLTPAGAQPALKWVRVNMKTNRVMLPNYCLNQSCDTAPLDTPVCWDGKTEQLSPGGALPACNANGMQNVYMLTSLAVTPGLRSSSARSLLRSEVVAPAIRPPGAITMDAANASAALGSSIPGTVVDGRPHTMVDRSVTNEATCSKVAALATDNAAVTSQLMQALDDLRKRIVDAANTSCNWDGTSQSSKICSPGLWWVRGTGSTPRFITTITTTTSGSNSGPGGDGDGDRHTITTTTACDPGSPNCYTNLDLSAPQLLATSASMGPTGMMLAPSGTAATGSPAPFTGNAGNQSSGSTYQSPLTTTLPNEIRALSDLLNSSRNQANYFAVSSANLAASYGNPGAPAIVVITDSSLVLQGRSLTGYGILVVPNDLEINNGGSLQWTGIVLVQPPQPADGTVPVNGNAQFNVTPGASGFINGALLLQPGSTSTATLNSTLPMPTSNPNTGPPFQITYSCEAIDMAFGSLPFKVLGSSQVSF